VVVGSGAFVVVGSGAFVVVGSGAFVVVGSGAFVVGSGAFVVGSGVFEVVGCSTLEDVVGSGALDVVGPGALDDVVSTTVDEGTVALEDVGRCLQRRGPRFRIARGTPTREESMSAGAALRAITW
jgi:hypothetical protein